MAHSTLDSERTQFPHMNRIHWLLAAQSLILILLTVNRLSSLTTGYVADNEFLRWVDFHNLLTLPLLSLTAFYFLKTTLEADAAPGSERLRLWIGLLFLLGIYIYGAGYGVHEVTNYLHIRFCGGQGATSEDILCRIVAFNDDEFSHWIWFGGFIIINVALLLTQAATRPHARPGARDVVFLLINAFFVAAAIFANLAFEEIGADLYIVAVVALWSFYYLWRKGPRPLFIYYAAAYGVGLAATGAYLLLRT